MRQFTHHVRGQIVALLAVIAAGSACAATNVDPANDGHRYGYAENAGWTNLAGDGVISGVTVSSSSALHGLSGFAWQENVGWINFGSGTPATPPTYSNASGADFGVNFDPATGNLSGLAWGENIGWINFDTAPQTGAPVRIDKGTGQFAGSAWSESLGWITFDNLGANTAAVPVNALPVSVSSFSLE